ncbi:MAG TPA: amino acid racemase [Anaeromyxobacteraceae bacterium]|nr:amino acid racemase [Anaeromyxobacteraceae bacterium]
MTEHIGIVGCSAEGAALCYRTICLEGPALLGGHAHPEVSLHTPSLAAYTALLERGDWQGVGELVLASADKLARVGAGFLVCPDNTLHQAWAHFEPRSPRPFLHIAEVVAGEAGRRGLSRLGLLGTRWLVESPVYPEKLGARGLACVLPVPSECAEVHRIIMEELVRGAREPRSVAYLAQVVAEMRARGCDGVVLACTEIPLVLGDANASLPTLDSTRLLARAALERAVHGVSGSR